MANQTKVIVILTFFSLILTSMGLFSCFWKPTVHTQASTYPYKDNSTNLVYNLLFCDNLSLYRERVKQPYTYPFDIIFSENSSVADLQKVIDDSRSDPRNKILACNRINASGNKTIKKELFAVIVELGMDNGLDVLASFNNGTARYINQTGSIIVWETTTDETINKFTKALFIDGRNIVNQMRSWDKPRKPQPTKGNGRITFLVSDGLYLSEGPINILFNNTMTGPALSKAAEIMRYLILKDKDARKLH